jgi:hypothetical protein
MTYCININNINYDNITIGNEKDYTIKTNTFKVKKLYYKYDLHISSELKLLTGLINIETVWKEYDKLIFSVKSSELKNIYNKLQNMINNNIQENIQDDIQDDIKNDNVRIYFKNTISELKLNPTKKSDLDLYILNKVENKNKLNIYYPNINKYDICGNFILNISIVNNKIKFIINTGDLKHPMSYIKTKFTTNIYDTNVSIDI